jgi:hypothetical protein
MTFEIIFVIVSDLLVQPRRVDNQDPALLYETNPKPSTPVPVRGRPSAPT